MSSDRVLVDTNVLVSFLTDRDPGQQGRAADVLSSAASGGPPIVVHQTVLAETVYVLRNLYRVEPGEIAAIFADLLTMPGVLPLDDLSWSKLLELWPEPFSDFADAALAAIASSDRSLRIATFDRGMTRRLESVGLRSYW